MPWEFGFPLKKLKKFCKSSFILPLLHHPTPFFYPSPYLTKKNSMPPFWPILRKSIPSFKKKGGCRGDYSICPPCSFLPFFSAFPFHLLFSLSLTLIISIFYCLDCTSLLLHLITTHLVSHSLFHLLFSLSLR